MGDYIYALRSPCLIRNVTVLKPDKSVDVVDAASMSYLFKPSLFDDNFNTRCWQIADRLFKIWENDGIDEYVPYYAVFTGVEERHKIKLGQTVCYFVNRDETLVRVPFIYNDGRGGWREYGTVIKIAPFQYRFSGLSQN